MKKSVPVRLLTAAAGLLLLVLGGCIAAEAFFGVQLSAKVGGFLAAGNALAVLGKLLILAALSAAAVAAVICALPCRKPKQCDYVMQKGENGPIGISVRAIEKQVRACVAKHDVIADAEVSVREARDGIVILLNVDQVSGVSIPLSVGLLQKQIRQYVTGCTGVDVQEVRVMVENNTESHVASAFAVEDAVCPPVPRATEEFQPERQSPAEPVPAEPEISENVPEPKPEPAPQPAPVVIPVELPAVVAEQPAEMEPEEDDRPLHQRVFGAEELPATVPVPPEMTVEPQPEAVEAEAAEEQSPEETAVQSDETEVAEDWSEPLLQAAAEVVLAEGTADVLDEAAAENDAEEENEDNY